MGDLLNGPGRVTQYRDANKTRSQGHDYRQLPGRVESARSIYTKYGSRRSLKTTASLKNEASWNPTFHIALDNDFYCSQARNYFDRNRTVSTSYVTSCSESPASPIKAIPVTWTNDIEINDEGEWNRVPPATKMGAPFRDLELDTHWDYSHHIIDDNTAHPCLRNYFSTEDLFHSKNLADSAYSEEFISKPKKNQLRALCDKSRR